MLYGMANNNVIIPAERDGALYNFLLGNQDYVFEGIGDEFEITPSASSFLITLGTGEGVICGRHVTEETANSANSMIQLSANSSGYVTICVDLSRPAGTEAYLRATPTLQQDDLNNSGTVRDLPLYQYTTNGSGVSSFVDVRNISAGSNVVCELDDGKLYAYHYEEGAVVRKQVGSLDPADLTATPADVKAGLTFGGAGSDEVQTGTFSGQSKTVTPDITAVTVTPDEGMYLSSVTVEPEKYGFSAHYSNRSYTTINGQVINAEDCIAYALVIAKADGASSSYPPTVTLQGYNGSSYENITVNLVYLGAASGGSGGGTVNTWIATGNFTKRYSKVKLTRPQNSVYGCSTQLFLFK